MSNFGIGLEPEYDPEDFPINIRFVCQGMVKVPKEKGLRISKTGLLRKSWSGPGNIGEP